jgi:hypothetical protein
LGHINPDHSGAAAILAAIYYIVRLEMRMGALENRKMQIGDKSLPEKGTKKFWDAEIAKQSGTGI